MVDSIITGVSLTAVPVLLGILDQVDLLTITIQVTVDKVVEEELDKMGVHHRQTHRVTVVEE